MPDFLKPLQNYYRNTFSQRREACINDLFLLSRGWESDIYAFQVQWADAGRPQQEDLVLRIYPGGDAYTKSAGEYQALTLLHRLGYPVPRVDCLERDASPLGMPFLIMERIHGQPLWRTMFRDPQERRQKLVALFCGLLARLHAIEWRDAVENPGDYEPGGDNAIRERGG